MKRWVVLCLLYLVLVGCSSNAYETRPFVQQEYRVEAHGEKTPLDRLVELDPGKFEVRLASDYLEHPPARIAVLPFTDRGSANVVVNKIPLTFRNREEREKWSWTDAQRLRRGLQGYLARREFTVINLNGIDAVLSVRGIDSEEELLRTPTQELGDWLGADTLVYGTVTNYEAYYFGLVAAWRVGVEIKVVSARDGEVLVEATGSRFDTKRLVALTLEDVIISAAENLLQLRDINLARSEEETCREIVQRIPVSDELKDRDRKAALNYAEDVDNARSNGATQAFKSQTFTPKRPTALGDYSSSRSR